MIWGLDEHVRCFDWLICYIRNILFVYSATTRTVLVTINLVKILLFDYNSVWCFLKVDSRLWTIWMCMCNFRDLLSWLHSCEHSEHRNMRKMNTLFAEQRVPLQRPESPMYIVDSMDAGYSRKDDDDDEGGLGFQNTLVSESACI